MYGVATFYTMFRKEPAGRFHLQVCTNLCCALNGAAELLRKVAEKTGAVPGGGPTGDGMWSLEEVECLASCGSAPCLQVNEAVYDEFVDEAQAGGHPGGLPPGRLPPVGGVSMAGIRTKPDPQRYTFEGFGSDRVPQPHAPGRRRPGQLDAEDLPGHVGGLRRPCARP